MHNISFVSILILFFISIYNPRTEALPNLPARWAGVDCKHVNPNALLVERLICSHMHLRVLNDQIADHYRQLVNRFSGSKAELVRDTQKFFLVARDQAQWPYEDDPKYVDQVVQKLEDTLKDRLAELEAAVKIGESSGISEELFTALTKNIKYSDFEFLEKFGRKMNGRTLRVYALLDAAKNAEACGTVLQGQLKHEFAMMNNIPSIPVVFKALTSDQYELIRYRTPISYHEVKIEVTPMTMILRMDSLLGRKL